MLKNVINYIKANRLECFILLVILVIAAFFRLYRIHEYMRFLGDEGRDALAVLRIMREADFPLIGPGTSVGNMYMGPLFYYMMLIPMAITGLNPIAAAVMVALVGVATVALLYYVGRLWFGPVAGLAAAALYAVSYLPITFGQSSWNPYPMPFFALLLIFSLYKVIQMKQSRWLLLTGGALAFTLQMHPLGLILLPVVGLFWLVGFWWFRKNNLPVKKYLKDTGFGLLVFGLLMSPLVVFDLKHDFMNFNAFKTFFTQREGTVNLNPINTLGEMWQTYTNLYVHRFLAYGFPLLGSVLSILIPLLLFSQGLIYKAKRHFSLAFVMLVVWLVVGITGITLIKSHIYDHYFGFMIPVGYLLIGMLTATLWSLHAYLRPIVLLVIAAYIGLLMTNSPHKVPAGKQLQRTQAVSRYILSEANGQPFNFALIAKSNYDDGYEFYFELWRHPMTIIDPQRFTETRTEQLFVACEDEICEPINNDRTEIANYGWKKIDTHTEIDGIEVFRLVPAAGPGE